MDGLAEDIRGLLCGSALTPPSLVAAEALIPRWVEYLAGHRVYHVPPPGTRHLGREEIRAQNLLNQLLLQEAVKRNTGTARRAHQERARAIRNLTGVRPPKP